MTNTFLTFNQKLRNFVERNPHLISRKESARYSGLFVLKYRKNVFYDNLWHVDPLLCECRGMVVDADYNIIARPFTKIFNYGENDTYIDRDEIVLAVEKVNGFMATVSRYNGQIIVSTTGSLDSKYVDMAKKHLPADYLLQHALTYTDADSLMFEICDENDPHIIDEIPGAYLIGIRQNYEYTTSRSGSNQKIFEHTLNEIANEINCYRPMMFVDTMDFVRRASQNSVREGYVVYGNNVTLKLKSPYYLATKFIARMNAVKLDKLYHNGTLKKKLPEEFYPFIEQIDMLKFCELDERKRIAVVRSFFGVLS